MTLIPLHAFSDNYIWIIKEKDRPEVWAVDPGDAQVVRHYCDTYSLNLAGILITHHHKDHTGGVAELNSTYQCPVYGPEHLMPLVTHPLYEGDSVTVFSRQFEVIATPGHTLDHLCYFHAGSDATLSPMLFCGDTLFRGGCGRIMEGTAQQMLGAMNKLRALPDNTLVYCTHEYTLANYRFAEFLDPDNTTLVEMRKDCEIKRGNDQVTLPSEMQIEKSTNPFLRSDFPHIIEKAAAFLGEKTAADPASAFGQVRRAKDTFS